MNFPYMKAWSDYLGQDQGHREMFAKLAAEEKQPPDVVFFDGTKNKWVRIDNMGIEERELILSRVSAEEQAEVARKLDNMPR